MEAIKDTSGAWMVKGTGTSCARRLAETVMLELGLDVLDWKIRSRLITAISDDVKAMLDSVEKGTNDDSN